jgi:hypothetical protein
VLGGRKIWDAGGVPGNSLRPARFCGIFNIASRPIGVKEELVDVYTIDVEVARCGGTAPKAARSGSGWGDVESRVVDMLNDIEPVTKNFRNENEMRILTSHRAIIAKGL